MLLNRAKLILASLVLTLAMQAQTFNWTGYTTNAASWTPSGTFNMTKATSGGGSFDVRSSSAGGTSAISGTAGSVAQNCSTYTGLRLEMSGAGNSSGTGVWNNNITLTINFPTFLCAPVTFNIYDITEAIYFDGSTNWVYYQDKVTISALDMSNNPVIPSATTTGPIDNTISGNNRVLTANNLNGQCVNQAVSVGTTGQKIKQITIVYSNQDLPTHCPTPNSSPYRYGFSQYQYIFISPITGTAAPTATITPGTLACGSSTTTLTAGTSANSPVYQWTGPGGSTIASPAASSTSVTGAGTYTLTINPAGCSSTATYALTPGGTPPNATAGPAQSITCANPTPTVSASSSTSGVTYSWSGPGAVSPGNTASGTVTTGGTYTVTVTETATGCSTTTTVDVSSNTTPPNISMGSGQSISCLSPTATVSGSSSTGGVTYGWTGPGTITPNNAASGTVSTAGTYTLTVNNPVNGCSSTGTVAVAANNTPPNISMGSAQTITCAAGTPTVSGSSSTGGVAYGWTGPGTITPNNASSGTVNTAGTYTLTVMNPANGCSSTGTVAVASNTTPPNISMGSAQTITCAAGTPTVSGSSSTGGVTYGWTGPGTITPNNAASGTVNTAGVYTLTVTNPANNCTSTGTVNVSSNTTLPNASAGSNQTLTCAATTATLSGSSSTGGVNYAWTGPASGTPAGTTPSNASTTVSAAGTYTLTVSNPANGCSATSTVNVSSSGALPDISTGSNQTINCLNSSVTISGSSSTGGVTYAWTGPTSGVPAGTTPASASTVVSAAGTYTLTVTDPSNSCSSSSTVNVTLNNGNPNISTSGAQALTCSATSVTISGSSSTSGVNYNWTGPTSGTPAGSAPGNASTVVAASGTYTLTVTDPSNGCSITATVNVSSNTTPPQISTGGDQTMNCTVTTATLNGSSSTPGATFSWEGPAAGTPAGTTPSASSTDVSTPGTYTLTVTDPANGCTASGAVLVSNNSTLPILAMGNNTSITCDSSSVTISGSSTTPGVTYFWSGPGTVTPNNAASGTVTTAGTYTLTVTNPNNNCSSNATITVATNTTLPDASAGAAQAISCTATTATLSGSSSTSGAVFSWEGPVAGTPAGTSPASNSTIVSAAGTYTLTVTDPANGCTASSTVNVSGSTTPPQISATGNPVLSCSASSVTIGGSSATPGVTFYWEGPTAGTPAGTTPANDSTDVIAAGTYTLTVTDPFNSCTSTATIIVSASSSLPQLSVSSAQNITCSSSTATVSGSSSTNGVTFSWTGPGTVTPNNAASGSVTTAGTYTLTVTDPGNGCSSSATVAVGTDTIKPNAAIANAVTLIDCINTSAVLSGSSSTSGATFSWEGPLAGTPAGTTPLNDSTNVSAAGTYTLTVTDPLNGCTTSSTIAVNANTSAPQISVSAGLSLNCTLSPVTLTGNSTTAGTTYAWTGPASGAPAGTTPANDSTDVTVAGTYTLTVTDPSNGCSSSATVAVAPNAGVPQISAGNNQVINCSNQSATLNGSSSTSGATFSWEGPVSGTAAGNTPNNASTSVNQSGTYTLTVTNPSNGCSSTQQVSVSMDTIKPVVNATATNSTIDCQQNSATITATAGGNASLTWMGPAGPVSGNPAVVTAAGNYTVTATDPSNGCSASSTLSIGGNTTTPSIASSQNHDTINCAAPFATLSAASLNANVTYSWSGPNGFASTQQSISGINAAGIYVVTALDTTNGCTTTDTLRIYQGTDPNAGFTATPTSGFAPLNVSFTNTSDNGFSGYAWSMGDGNFSTLANPTDIYTASGTYTVTLIALHASPGCNDTATMTIVVEDELSIEIPNIFTPNGDGTNDIFFIKSKGVKDLHIDIFNRWGQLEKQLYGINASWDGMNLNNEKASDGTYYYILYATGADGKETDKAGHVLLTR